MRRIAIVAVIVFVVVGMAGIVIPAYSQQKTEQQITSIVLAEVVSVDLEKSTLAIKTVKDAVATTYESQTISVLPETKILKGDVALKLIDLKAGDKVTVKYSTDVSGKQKVESITLVVAEALPVAK